MFYTFVGPPNNGIIGPRTVMEPWATLTQRGTPSRPRWSFFGTLGVMQVEVHMRMRPERSCWTPRRWQHVVCMSTQGTKRRNWKRIPIPRQMAWRGRSAPPNGPGGTTWKRTWKALLSTLEKSANVSRPYSDGSGRRHSPRGTRMAPAMPW